MRSTLDKTGAARLPRQLPRRQHHSAWQRPVFTHFWNDSTPYHHSATVVLRKAGWGWDQACFHYYLLEQERGALPPHCPEMVIDYAAQLVLSVGGFARKLKWSDDGRVTFSPTGSRPCVLHGNGIQGKPLINKARRRLAKARGG